MDVGRIKQEVKRMADDVPLPKQYRLGLFGSRVTGGAGRFSDVDVAVWGPARLPVKLWSELEEKFQNSDLPYFVDMVDLSLTSKEFRDMVLQEVQWL